ncbi:MAG: hypothetical protein KGL59_05835 [Acidobacteriota bacterium]|nr:hypothetical protein [Acidobacteriota bacterium]
MGEARFEFAAEDGVDAEMAEPGFVDGSVEAVEAEFRAGIQAADGIDELDGQAGGCVHGDVEGDEVRFADRGFVERLAGKIEAADCVAAFSQPSGGRSQAEWLAAEFVGRD